jgi:hypothetical protein
LFALNVVAVQIGILIFVVDAVRRLVHAVEQISIEAAKHTEILNALVREVSVGNTDTRRDT